LELLNNRDAKTPNGESHLFPGFARRVIAMSVSDREDSKTLAARLREAHGVCEEHGDIATASLIEVWIDETERRTWFVFEASRVTVGPS
jgi:hypothetical protein